MTKKIKLLVLPLAVLSVLILALAGCDGGATSTVTSTSVSTATTTATTTAELSGTVTEGGSTTVQPLAETLAGAFMEIFPKVKITIGGGGSGAGVTSVSNGTVDIGAASRKLKESEQGLGLVVHVLAYDGIAIVTHPSQTVDNLTEEQIKGIFSGEITNWSEVGGPNKAIVVVSREEGSGTRGAFEELVMGGALIVDTALLQNTNAGVKLTVAGNQDAVGYISFGYLDSTVKAVDIGGAEATVANTKNGTYPIVRPLLFLTKGEATGLTKEFIDFCLGTAGQAIVAEDYISVLD